MRPKTPKRIQPRRLLLKPNGRPVPSVLSLSSTKAMAGLDIVTAHAAAINDAPIPKLLDLLSTSPFPFPSIEHLTPPFFPKEGNPRRNGAGEAAGSRRFCTREVRTAAEAAEVTAAI